MQVIIVVLSRSHPADFWVIEEYIFDGKVSIFSEEFDETLGWRCHVVRLMPDEALSVKLRQLRRSRPS
uniref:hypothetical protein n=1 Tax=Rhizobium sp. TaxID=391 RepID=UPI0028B1D8CA